MVVKTRQASVMGVGVRLSPSSLTHTGDLCPFGGGNGFCTWFGPTSTLPSPIPRETGCETGRAPRQAGRAGGHALRPPAGSLPRLVIPARAQTSPARHLAATHTLARDAIGGRERQRKPLSMCWRLESRMQSVTPMGHARQAVMGTNGPH